MTSAADFSRCNVESNTESTSKDLIATGSTLGLVLKMMQVVDDETLSRAMREKTAGEVIGAVLLRMNVITAEQLDRALDWQKRMREAKNIDEIHDLLEAVDTTERAMREALFDAIPPTNPGFRL